MSPPPSPRQPSVYFCLYKFACGTFCTNGIIQYVVLWDWLLSWSTRFARFIHAAAFISTFLFTPNNIPLCGYITSCVSVHQLMEVCIVSTLWLLWVMLPWTCVYKVLCGHLFSFLLDVDRPRSRIAGSDTSCVQPFGELPEHSGVAAPFYLPSRRVSKFRFLRSLSSCYRVFQWGPSLPVWSAASLWSGYLLPCWITILTTIFSYAFWTFLYLV